MPYFVGGIVHTVHGTEELCCLCVQGVSTDPDQAGPRIAEVGGRKMLQLLNDCSGAFRPGILTALVGSSGAGKTTLMDVLAGRKTSARTNLLFFHRLVDLRQNGNFRLGVPKG